jgi:hypothetical protein
MIAMIMCVLGLLGPATIILLYSNSAIPIVHAGFVNVVYVSFFKKSYVITCLREAKTVQFTPKR